MRVLSGFLEGWHPRRDFRLWNQGLVPFNFFALLLVGAFSLLLIYFLFGCGFPNEWGISTRFGFPVCSDYFGIAILTSYGGVTILFGASTTLFFAELNIRIAPILGLRQPPNIPRLRSVYTGLTERVLFTTFGILVVFNPNLPPNAAIAGVALIGGYLAFKQYYSEGRRLERQRQTIHAIWGSGLSMGIAILSSWWFWQLAPEIKNSIQ